MQGRILSQNPCLTAIGESHMKKQSCLSYFCPSNFSLLWQWSVNQTGTCVSTPSPLEHYQLLNNVHLQNISTAKFRESLHKHITESIGHTLQFSSFIICDCRMELSTTSSVSIGSPKGANGSLFTINCVIGLYPFLKFLNCLKNFLVLYLWLSNFSIFSFFPVL